MLKAQIFEKKDFVPAKKTLSTIFSRIIKSVEPQWTYCEDPKGFLTLTVEVLRLFLAHLKNS